MNIEGRFRQIIDFSKGQNSMLSPEVSPTYFKAVNMTLAEDGYVTALSRPKGEVPVNVPLNPGHQWKQIFSCRGNFGSGKVISQCIVGFTENPKTGSTCIWVVNSQTGTFHKIYDDDQSTRIDRPYNLKLGTELDAFMYQDGGKYFLVWIDFKNPLRYIEVSVKDPSVVDNSVPGLSPLYIANDPDLLYVQALWPVDPMTISGVANGAGRMPSGTYVIWYRYWNSQTRKYSTWSLGSTPLTVFADRLNATTTNDLKGSPHGTPTDKAIAVIIARESETGNYYDAVQFAVGEYNPGGSGAMVVKLLAPSKSAYGTGQAPAYSQFNITGNEAYTEEILTNIVVDSAEVLTGMTLTLNEGRLFLSNIEYWDLRFADDYPDAYTYVKNLACPIDPMDAQTANGKGYYDPMNGFRYKGHFRGEVYRYGKSYVNRFGFWGKVKTIDFSREELKYLPEYHGSTWQLNWAGSGYDWKFPDRQSGEGSLFADNIEALRAFGLGLDNVKNHPDWAYGLGIFRLPRKRDILGQSPIINGVAIHGGAHPDPEVINSAFFSAEKFSMLFYSDSSLPVWDYNGQEDFYMPKLLSMGHAKNLTYHKDITNLGAGTRYWFNYLAWKRIPTKIRGNAGSTVDFDATDGAGGNTVVPYRRELPGIVFMYPLESISAHESNYTEDQLVGGYEKIKVIDCVLLQSFNGYRDPNVYNGYTEYDYMKGRGGRYAFVFSPLNKSAYYYHNENGHDPREMFAPGAVTASNNPIYVAPETDSKVLEIWKINYNSPTTPIGYPLSTHEDLIHVRKILNLEALAIAQYEDPLEMFSNGDPMSKQKAYPSPAGAGICLHIRAIEGDDADNNPMFIYDPTFYIWKNYIEAGAPGTFANLFGSNVPISDIAAEDVIDPVAPYISNINASNDIIEPGSTIPLYIGNILAGLSDDRYGDKDLSDQFIHTGTYLPINGDDIAQNTPKSMYVFGGDCYITRLTAAVHYNAPRIVRRVGNPLSSEFTYTKDGVAVSTGAYYYPQKVSTHNEYCEIVDLWVESTVNGHWTIRPDQEYPRGVTSRDPAGGYSADLDALYSYPKSGGLASYFTPRLYQLDMGHVVDMFFKTWLGFNSSAPFQAQYPARTVASPVKIEQAVDMFYDRFLANEYFDIAGGKGPITSIHSIGSSKLVVVQEDGVAMIYIGRTLSEDSSGLSLVLGTGKVFGYFTYLSSNLKGEGSYGAMGVRSAVRLPTSVAVFDQKRNNVFLVGELLDSITDANARVILDKMQGLSNQLVRGQGLALFDSVNKTLFVVQNGFRGSEGLRMSALMDSMILESNVSGGLFDVATSNGKTYAITNPSIGTEAAGGHVVMYEGGYDSHFHQKQQSIHIFMNTPEHKGQPKRLHLLTIHADGDPGLVYAVVRDASGIKQQSPKSPGIRRRNSWIFNKFFDSANNRMAIRGEVIEIVIEPKANSTQPLRIFSIETEYTLDQEHK